MEPIINPGIELQATSRIHRIGQTKQTTVWQYIIKRTVEQTVLNLSTIHRLEHLGIANTTNSIAPIGNDILEQDESSHLRERMTQLVDRNTDGEQVPENDLLECLVGSKRLNRILVQDDDVNAAQGEDVNANMNELTSGGVVSNEQADANRMQVIRPLASEEDGSTTQIDGSNEEAGLDLEADSHGEGPSNDDLTSGKRKRPLATDVEASKRSRKSTVISLR